MYSVKDENRFWSKVETGEIDECWECVAMYLIKSGYGQFGVKRKIMLAHRFSYQLFHNRLIKDKMFICHKCDNPKCVNPHHLFEATHQENMIDRDNKGRGQKGENHGLSKLNEIQVLEIRAKYKNGGTTQRQLGREYGVNHTLIGNIINRKLWKQVE
jgi:hypothetical protein